MTDILYRGGDLQLRNFIPEDFKHIVSLNQEIRVTESLFEKALLSNRYIAQYFVSDVISRYEKEAGLGSWVAEKRNAKNEWVFQGWFNLSPVPEDAFLHIPAQDTADLVELGSRLTTAAWGSQLSTLLGDKLLKYAFEDLSLPCVYIHCLPTNRAAIYCTAFLGFEPVGQITYFGQDSLQFSLSAARFSHWCTLPTRQKKLAGVAIAKHLTVESQCGITSAMPNKVGKIKQAGGLNAVS